MAGAHSNQEAIVQLRDYVQILSKRGWIIILMALLTAGSAFVFSRLQTPVYRSTIYLNVWSARLDWGLQQTIKSQMRNYAGNITSRTTAAEVDNRLQLDLTPDEIRSKLTVSPIEADFLIQIDADDYDPLIARDIAQTTAEVFVEVIHTFNLKQDRADQVDVFIRDPAEPGALHKPKWKINTLAGGIFGVLLGSVIVFVLQWLQADILRSSQEVERHTGIAVLGVIPAASTKTHSRRTRPTTAPPAAGLNHG